MGCFTDDGADIAIPSVEGSCSFLDGRNADRRFDAIEKCYKCAKLAGHTFFALQDSACMTSSTAGASYNKHGAAAADACGSEGTGGSKANDVYEIVGKDQSMGFVYF